MSHALTNWKTSLSGVLSFVIATGAVLTALPPSFLSQKYLAYATIATGLAKAYIGLISKDAGTVEAIPASGGPAVAMPSTEIPIEPGATLVPKDTI